MGSVVQRAVSVVVVFLAAVALSQCGSASQGHGGAGGAGGSGQPADAGGGSDGAADVGASPDAAVERASGIGGAGADARDAQDSAAPDSGLHGGTSGRFICPAGGASTGATPTLVGDVVTAAGPGLPANAEGPVWVAPLGALLFTSKDDRGTDVRQIWKLTPPALTWVSIKTGVGNNGMTLDPDDKLVSADHQRSAVVRLDPTTGNVIEVIAGTYQGGHFRSPNDVIVRGDGNLYFSDPEYAVTEGPQPKVPTTAFYRVSPPPARQVSVVEDTGHRDPNGLALSPDDNTLYTLVTGDRVIKKWALDGNGAISGPGAVLVGQTGLVPDGICVDCAGNLYVGTQQGLEVYSPTGAKLTTFWEGTAAINCSFGGADHRTLFVTTDGQIQFARTSVPGLP